MNIASVAGMIGIDRRAAYSTSKGGVIALTRSVAMDFRGAGHQGQRHLPRHRAHSLR